MQCRELGTWLHDSKSFLLKYQMMAGSRPATENRLDTVLLSSELPPFFSFKIVPKEEND